MSGTLHFTLTEAKSYKQITLGLYGGALVRWTESRSTGQTTTTNTVTYQSKETYVEQATVLWNSEQSPDGRIGPGTYSLPFEFMLPSTCLGSFQGSCGAIKYALHGRIKTGLLHRDHSIEVPIQVNKITDINLPHLMVPTYQSKQKQVGFFCFASSVEFTASLTRSGFCIGHNLPLTVSIVNGSSRRIKMRASIKRRCTYHAQGHTRSERRKLVAVVSPDIAPHSHYTWNVDDLLIPMVEPSFKESAIIKMQYILQVTAVIPWAWNSSVTIPITLGNVPFNCYT